MGWLALKTTALTMSDDSSQTRPRFGEAFLCSDRGRKAFSSAGGGALTARATAWAADLAPVGKELPSLGEIFSGFHPNSRPTASPAFEVQARAAGLISERRRLQILARARWLRSCRGSENQRFGAGRRWRQFGNLDPWQTEIRA